MKKFLFIIYLSVTITYAIFYQLVFIKYGEMFQYIINPLVWGVFVIVFYITLFKNNRQYYENRKSILPIVVIGSLLYVIFLFTLGFGFGYLNNPYSNKVSGIVINLFSVILIIVIKEIIREIFLNETKNYKTFYSFIIFIVFLISDLNLLGILKIKFEIDSIIYIFFKYIFSPLAINLFSHYLVKKGGYQLSSIYRVITYMIFIVIPIVPKLDYIIESLFSAVFPLLMFVYIEYTLSKRNKFIPYDFKYNISFKSWIIFFGIVTVVIIFSLGGFSIKPVVILSGSMEPHIFPGDLLLIKRCDIKDVKVNDIIEFREGDITIVHRVVKVKNANNEIELTTMGDNNKTEDKIKTTYTNFMGCLNYKLKYAGYPTYLIYKMFRT